MRKFSCLFTFIMLMWGSLIFAKEVPIEKARQLGKAAFSIYSKTQNSNDNARNSNLKIKSEYTKKVKGKEYYHVLNFDGGGFIIISGNDDYSPVLGFSDVNSFNFNDPNFNQFMGGLMEGHQVNMDYIEKNKKHKNERNVSKWKSLESLSSESTLRQRGSFTEVVSPLTTTKWGQDGYYNAECPEDPGGVNGNTYCGCVPVAVSQLIKYYDHPVQGNGSNEYQSANYGVLSSDYCNTTYNWSNMPDVLTAPNADVAELIYQVGTSMETEYSTSYTGTYAYKLVDALINNFGYDDGIKSFNGTNHDSFVNITIRELDQSRPVLYGAFDLDENDFADRGHAWVGDGYGYDMNGTFYVHFNWGWNGSNNGWFLDYQNIPILDGYWDPLNDGEATIPYFWYRDTYYEIFPAANGCHDPSSQSLSAGPSQNYVWLYYNKPDPNEVGKFQYRVKGTTTWLEVGETTYAIIIQNLSQGTTYEYRAARMCCSGWSDYSEIQEFTTESSVSAPPRPSQTDITVYSSCVNRTRFKTTEYIGTIHRYRWRVRGTTTWTVSGNTSNQYLWITGNWEECTKYDVQLRVYSNGQWSSWSPTKVHTTRSLRPDQSGIYADVLSPNFAYLYCQGHTGDDKQFYYKALTDGATNQYVRTTLHYAPLSLVPNTQYEYKVRKRCGVTGAWSCWSPAQYFTTPPDASSRSNNNNILEQKTTTNLENEDIKIYPNPIRGNHIDVELLNSMKKIESISIMDIHGRLIWSNEFDNVSNVRITTNDWASGVYIITINRTFNKRLVK